MKNNMLIVLLVLAIIGYKFQDKFFPPEKPKVILEKKVPVKISPTTLRLDEIHYKSGLKQFAPADDLPNLTKKLNQHLLAANVALEIKFNFVDHMTEFYNSTNIHQLGITRTLMIANWVEKGEDIRPIMYVSPYETPCFREAQIITLQSSPVNTLNGLNGKKISTLTLSNFYALPLRKMIKENNLTFAEVKETESLDIVLDNLKNGSVDAAGVYEGFLRPENPEFSLYKILHTSQDKTPCYTLYASKKIDVNILEKLKTELQNLASRPETNQLLMNTLRMRSFEPITNESWSTLMKMHQTFPPAPIPTPTIEQ